MTILIHKQSLSPLTVDKVSFVYKPKPEDIGEIAPSLSHLYDAGYAKPCKMKLYKHSYRIFLGDHNEQTLVIQCAPWQAGHSYFRAEFNPNKVSMGEVKSFIAYSRRSLPLIPRQGCHPFQRKAATDSRESCHPCLG